MPYGPVSAYLPWSSPSQPRLYIAAEGANPKGTDQVITTMATALKVLPIAARHSAQLYISGSLSELALGAVAVSYAAIAILVRRRALRLGPRSPC